MIFADGFRGERFTGAEVGTGLRECEVEVVELLNGYVADWNLSDWHRGYSGEKTLVSIDCAWLDGFGCLLKIQNVCSVFGKRTFVITD